MSVGSRARMPGSTSPCPPAAVLELCPVWVRTCRRPVHLRRQLALSRCEHAAAVAWPHFAFLSFRAACNVNGAARWQPCSVLSPALFAALLYSSLDVLTLGLLQPQFFCLVSPALHCSSLPLQTLRLQAFLTFGRWPYQWLLHCNQPLAAGSHTGTGQAALVWPGCSQLPAEHCC